MSLVASLIVKDELDRYLEPCIRSLQDFCDEIAVVDDASTDGTFEWLAEQEKVDVIQLPSSDGFFDGHEGRRRQYLIDFTIKRNPTFVLAIDADEFIADGDTLRRFIEAGGPVLGTLEMQEVWGMSPDGLSIRVDGGWRPHPCPILWRADRSTRWTIQNRALACGREPMQVRSVLGRARPTGTEILHFGWANPETRAARHERYVVADGGKFHQSRHLDSIMLGDDQVLTSSRSWPTNLSLVEGRVTYARPVVA